MAGAREDGWGPGRAWGVRRSPRSGDWIVTTGFTPSLMIHVRIGIVGRSDDVHTRADEANPRARTAAAEVRMHLANRVQHRTVVTQSADAIFGRRVEGRVDKERASSLRGPRNSRGQFGRRSTSGELLQRILGEEMRVRSLDFSTRELRATLRR